MVIQGHRHSHHKSNSKSKEQGGNKRILETYRIKDKDGSELCRTLQYSM